MCSSDVAVIRNPASVKYQSCGTYYAWLTEIGTNTALSNLYYAKWCNMSNSIIMWQHENMSVVAGPLWGESSEHLWIPLKKDQ